MTASRFTPSRSAIRSAIRSAFPDATDAQLALATGATARAMLGATDTGMWHGPVEAHTYNSHHTAGSFRLERHATDTRDIGALRHLARLADATGAGSAAEHLRRMASIFADRATFDAYAELSAVGAITGERSPGVDHGPTLERVHAYHRADDVFVEVVAHRSRTTAIVHPQRGACDVPTADLDFPSAHDFSA